MLFSGGAASSYVAYLLTKEKKISFKDIILLYTPTLSECEEKQYQGSFFHLVRFPLAEKRITTEDCKRIIRDEWKIELPSAYKSLKHTIVFLALRVVKIIGMRYGKTIQNNILMLLKRINNGTICKLVCGILYLVSVGLKLIKTVSIVAIAY